MNRKLLVVSSLFALVLGCSGDDNHDHGDAGDDHHHHDNHHNHHHHDDDGGHSHSLPDLGEADLGVSITEAAKDYCSCMLLKCHDDYHVQWGEDHVEAAAACQQEAAALPQAGSVQTVGNSVECRLHHCASLEDGSTCEGALGAACVD